MSATALGAPMLRSMHPGSWVLLARGRIFFFPQPGFSSPSMNLWAPKPQFPGPRCPSFRAPLWSPSCPHRTVAAEVRKQVSRERSGSPHSSRRCSSSLGVSVWEALPHPPCCGGAEAGRGPAVAGEGGSQSRPSTVAFPFPVRVMGRLAGPPLQGAAPWVVKVGEVQPPPPPLPMPTPPAV